MHLTIFAECEGSELDSCIKLRCALQSSELHTRSILPIFYLHYQEVDELFKRVIRDIKNRFLDMPMRSLLALSLGVCIPSLAMAASLASLINASPSERVRQGSNHCPLFQARKCVLHTCPAVKSAIQATKKALDGLHVARLSLSTHTLPLRKASSGQFTITMFVSNW